MSRFVTGFRFVPFSLAGLSLAGFALSGLVLTTACGTATSPEIARCNVDGDCSALMDGLDPCAMHAVCEEGLCKVDSAPVACTASECQIGACDPATGACAFTPVSDGVACSDQDPCTSVGSCRSGTCLPGSDPCATIAGPCEVSACDPSSGACSTTPKSDFAGCDDGDACTSDDTCLVGTCRGAPRVCPEPDGPCLVASCDRASGTCLAAPRDDGTTCDDGDACTLETTCSAGACSGGRPKCATEPGSCQVATCDGGSCGLAAAPNGSACDDGNFCTVGEACESGQCGAGEPKCPASATACVSIVCDLADGGCIKAPVAGPCTDGNACTTEDLCAAGVCHGTPVECVDNAQCHPVACSQLTGSCVPAGPVDGLDCNDGDLCTAFDRCKDEQCVGVAACPDDGSTCTLEACNPATGGCSVTTLADGLVCDDDNPCTGSGTCAAGSCLGGAPVVCSDDGSSCTLEQCEAIAGGCVSVPFPDGAACDDGEVCTTGSVCDRGVCEVGTAALCPGDGDPCTAEVCDPALGCRSVALDDGAECDDGEPCTADERCTAGQCVGAPRICESASPCATADCTPGIGCVTTASADGSPCDDRSACTSGERCLGGTCAPVSTVVCPATGEPCLDPACDPATGTCSVLTAEAGRPCDDGSVCTVADACAGTICAGVMVQCESPSACELGVCDQGLGGCAVVPFETGAPCDVGDLCKVAGTCNQGVCSSKPLICPDDKNPCTTTACTSGKGCQNKLLPAATPCEDGDPCSSTSACAATGLCTSTATGTCPSDGDPCTSDACVAGKGCVYALTLGGACDDGDRCTSSDSCLAAGVCKGTATACPEVGTNACVLTRCDPTAGCVVGPAPDGTACDDANGCTVSDQCNGGVCSGAARVCPEVGLFCEKNVCDGASGACVVVPAVGLGCDDGLACTVLDACDADAVCRGSAKACPGAGPCVRGACIEGTGACTTSPAPDGAPCDDGEPCLTDDRCLAGTCRAGGAPKCPPSGPCQLATCAPTGACGATPRVDGLPCDDGSQCSTAAACASGACNRVSLRACDDGDPCTVDTCVDAVGCTFTAFEGLCDDGQPCTVGDTCGAAGCVGSPKTCVAGPCEVAACAPATGLCATAPRQDETPCTDGDPCTDADRCTTGQCLGVPHPCSPPGPCLVASCVPGVGCAVSAAADGAACDGSPCLSGETCTAGGCSGGSPIICPHGPCTIATCSAAAGCGEAPRPDGEACADGEPCHIAGACASGVCATSAVTCPAPDACHLGVCLPGVGCTVVVAPDGTTCSDGDLCTLADTCQSGGCAAGLPKSCVGSVCEPEHCVTSTGECAASLATTGTPCEDGNACTPQSACAVGQCVGSGALACPPTGDPCFVGTCLPGSGCTVVPAPGGTTCDDGDACTQADGCRGGVCAGTLAVTCAASTGCVGSVCDPTSGVCVPTLLDEAAPCDDGEPCSHGDHCAASQCVSLAAQCCASDLACDDADPRTTDRCVTGQCVHTPAAVALRVLAVDGSGGVTLLDGALSTLNTITLTGIVELTGGGPLAATRSQAGVVATVDATGVILAMASLNAERVGFAAGSLYVVEAGRLVRRDAHSLAMLADLGPAPTLPLTPIPGDDAVWVPSRLGRARWFGDPSIGGGLVDVGIGGALTTAAFDPISARLVFGSTTSALWARGADGGTVVISAGAADVVATAPGVAGVLVARADGMLEFRAGDASLTRTVPLGARALALSARPTGTLVTTATTLSVLDANGSVGATRPGTWRAATWLDVLAP